MTHAAQKPRAADPGKVAALEKARNNHKYSASPGLAHYERLSGRRSTPGNLDRGSLPAPVSYLIERHFLSGNVRGEWATIRCPVHKGGAENHPSLRVSLVDGHFRCMACGAAGGDIIALHRLVTGLAFRDAVRDLGARFHE